MSSTITTTRGVTYQTNAPRNASNDRSNMQSHRRRADKTTGKEPQYLLKLHPIFLGPFLHHTIDHVYHLWVVFASQQIDNLLQFVGRFLLGHDLLEYADCCPTLAFPELGVRVQALQHIKSLTCIVEVSHLVAIICNEMQQIEGVVTRVHANIHLPSNCRLIAVDVAPRQPTYV